MRLTGTISYYNPNLANPFGFISVKIPSGAGFIINKYFFHWSRVVKSEIEENQIEKGCVVEFSISDRPSKPGRDPVAVDIHIFAKPSPATIAAVTIVLSGEKEVGGAS